MAQAQAGDVDAKEVAGVQNAQVQVALGVQRHRGHNAHAHAQLYIGFDHVSIHGREHHIGAQATGLEGFVDVGTPGVALFIGNDGVSGQLLQRHRLGQRQQRVTWRHDDAVRPAVARQGDELGVIGQGLGGHANVGLARQQHGRHLLGRALAQVQRDFGKAVAKVFHHRRQGVARLRVRGRHGKLALQMGAEVVARAFEVVSLQQQALDDGQQRCARRGQAGQALACTHKHLHPQFTFQFTNLAAHARL